MASHVNNEYPALEIPPEPPPALTRDAPQWLSNIEHAQEQNLDRTLTNPWPTFLAGQADKPVRVLLVDEDGKSRGAIARELVMDSRVCVVGEAGSLLEAKRVMAQQDFDVMILDTRLGGGKGFDLIEAAKARSGSAEIIVHSTLDDEAHVRRAFTAGAAGYLVKNSWFQNYPQAVLQVVNGGAAVSPNVVRRLLVRLAPFNPGNSNDERASRKTLSKREIQVLRLVATGHVTQDIAHRLSISGGTVGAHMKSICLKLQVRTRAHAVVVATSLGLL